MRFFLYITLVSFPIYSLADDSDKVRSELVVSIQYFAYALSIVMGVMVLKSIVSTLLDYDRFKQQSENPMHRLAMKVLISAVLLSPQMTLNMTMNTLGYETKESESYCFAYTSGVEKKGFFGGTQTGGAQSACIKESTNKYVNDLVNKLNDTNKTELSDFLGKNFTFLVGMFQGIALIFYFLAWFKIYSISEGKERQTTYGRQMLVLLFSALVINLPKTIEVSINFFKSIKLVGD